MLSDLIRNVLLQEGAVHLSNEEIAARVAASLSPEDQVSALLEALRTVVSMQRGQIGKQLLRSSAAAESQLVAGTGGRIPPAGSFTAGGRQYASPRTAALHDQVLHYAITGSGGRRVLLGQANRADLRSEIDISRRRGTTLVERAQVFDDMLHELAAAGLRFPSQLSPESRAKYGRRIAELGS